MGATDIATAPAQVFKLPWSQLLLIFLGLIVVRLVWKYSGHIADSTEGGIQAVKDRVTGAARNASTQTASMSAMEGMA